MCLANWAIVFLPPASHPKNAGLLVIIITCNANNQDRWAALWHDPFVQNVEWDVICLQEVGNPRPEWTARPGNKPWPTTQFSQPAVFRYYTYNPPTLGNLVVTIIHCEWVSRQKNHTVMILPRDVNVSAFNMSSEKGVTARPYMGIKVQLSIDNVGLRWVLLGCVHVVANPSKAPIEVIEALQWVHTACHERGTAEGQNSVSHLGRWLLFGDFNSNPQKIGNVINSEPRFTPPLYPNGGTTYFNGGETHQSGRTIDYGAYSHLYLLPNANAPGSWERGIYFSDHYLMKFEDLAVAVENYSTTGY
jgi:endonuclease/exonuclease/phosphatase family metal-dependent hydrolase